MKNLAFEKIFLNAFSDKYYDEEGSLKTGLNYFNDLLQQYYPSLPKCEMFSGGSQSLSDGSVRMFIHRSAILGGRYGVNFTSKASFSIDITVMLPSGVFDQEAWQQSIGYQNVLVACLEKTTQLCDLNAVVVDWEVSYFTQASDGAFDIFEALNKIENKKLVLTVKVEKFFLGDENEL